MTQHKRICSFCSHSALYDDFPDGSAVYLGIASCATCLGEKRTEAFRKLIEEKETDYERSGFILGN